MSYYSSVSVGDERPSFNRELAFPWAYVHFPKDWFFYNGEWLPQLSIFSFELPLGEGHSYIRNPWTNEQFANLIKERDDGRMLFNATLIIPSDPDLEEYKEYVKYLRPVEGGEIYPTMWDSWVLEDRKITNEFDRAGYNEFLRHLVKKSIIQPPSRERLVKLILDPMNTCYDMIRDNPETNYNPESLVKEMFNSVIEILKGSKKENLGIAIGYIDEYLAELQQEKVFESQRYILDGVEGTFQTVCGEATVQYLKDMSKLLELSHNNLLKIGDYV